MGGWEVFIWVVVRVVVEVVERIVVEVRVGSGRNKPFEVAAEPVDGFLSRKPCSHLFDVVLLVSSGVGVLRIINMETFWRLGVVTVSRAVERDHLDVVLHRVNLQDVEVILSPSVKFNEHLLVGMKGIEGRSKQGESLRRVRLEQREVDEVNHCMDRHRYLLVGRTINNQPQENLLHLLVL